MASSTNYLWSEPDNTSLVKDGAQAIRTLGDAIDTSLWNSGFGQAGKNKLINGDFTVNQRSFTSTTTSNTYGFDRWALGASDGTTTYTTQAFTAGTAPVAGYEGTNYARLVTTGQTLSTANSHLRQPIEDVRTFAGQTVTVSFWAQAGSGTPKIAAELTQTFGTTGSPSAAVNTYAGQVTLSTSWARYSVTIAVPSISGKTLTSNSSLTTRLFVSAGSDFNSRTGTLGIQTNTFNIWGVQVEYGSKATPFQTASGGSIQGELAMCQRYYEKSYNQATAPGTGSILGNGQVGNVTSALAASTAGNVAGINSVPFKVSKRAAPTMRAYDYDGTIDAVRVYPADAKKTGVTAFNGIQESGSFSFMSFSATATAVTLNGNVMYNWTAVAEL